MCNWWQDDVIFLDISAIVHQAVNKTIFIFKSKTNVNLCNEIVIKSETYYITYNILTDNS